MALNERQVRLHENEQKANQAFYRHMGAKGRLDLNKRTKMAIRESPSRRSVTSD